MYDNIHPLTRQPQTVLVWLEPYQINNLFSCSEFQTADKKVTSLSQYVCGSLTFQIYYESVA
jgi:hypothetical protein